jgi:cell division septation protein DedD
VVIFLCGVLVGRGVKTERTTLTSDAGTANSIQDAPPLPPSAPVQTAAAGPEPATAAPPTVQEDKFSYPARLEDGPRKETLKPAAPTPPPAPIPVPKAAAPAAAVAPKEAKPKPEPTAPAPAPAAAAAPHGDGYAIQVAALREPGEADTIAKRLVSKGYDAYVLTPPGGTPNVYRVRVGSFKTRRDAEPTAAKLQQEEQFKPWITR